MLAVIASALLLTAPPTASELATQSEAVDASNPDGIAALEAAVRDYEAKPQELLADHKLAGALMEARLALAWVHFDVARAPNMQDARVLEGLDEVVRIAAVLGRQPSLKNFEPEFVSLFKERAARLEGGELGVIKAKCAVSCQLIIDEARTMNPTNPIPYGIYRVWVVADANQIDPLQTSIVVDAPEVVVEFTKPPEPPPPPPPDPKPKRTRNKPQPEPQPEPKPQLDAKARPTIKPSKRLLPGWAEALGIVAGAGLVGGGVVLLALDETCRDDACDEIAETTIQGATLTAVGAAAIVAFTAVLVVDTMRAKRGKPERVRVEAGRIRF